MTKIDERNDHGSPDNNLDRLLELGEPLPRMPEDLKARIRARLAEVGQDSGKKNFLFRRWAIVSPLAAAAVLALFLIFFWPGGTPGTISWADVQKQLEQVHTMTFRGCMEISTTRGKQIIECGKVYYKDPGYGRSEVYAPDADFDTVGPGIESIRIAKSEPGLTELLTLHPGSRRAELVTQILRSSGPEPPARQFGETASKNWNLMKQITADKTKRIGNRVINGKPVVGFAFEVSREFIPTDAAGNGRGQLWASRDDRVPLLGEVEYRNVQGQTIRMELSDIQWNVPLDESLFDLSVPTDWSLSRTLIESAEYADTGLAPGVTLQIGPEEQEPVAAAWDVSGIVKAKQTTNPDSRIPSEVRITIDLKPKAAQRLHDFADDHPDQLIVVNFNGQIRVAAELDAAHPTQLSFDLTWLGLSLTELEEKYFTTTIERRN